MKSENYLEEIRAKTFGSPSDFTDDYEVKAKKAAHVLADVEHYTGSEIVVNCAHRTKAHDIAKGRGGGSKHGWINGVLAIDISHNNLSKARTEAVIEYLRNRGDIARIARYNTFIHFEISSKRVDRTKLYNASSGTWYGVKSVKKMWP